MFDNYNFNRAIIPYWEHFGLQEKDFYCRECGKLMLDFNKIRGINLNEKYGFNSNMIRNEAMGTFVEGEQNRWLIKGRTLSNKTYFRHHCWDCFFKHLGEIEDIPKRARKSSWYKKIHEGNLVPPPTWVTPSKYFKLLFDITDEELAIESKKFDTASLESFIRRHGEKEGIIKYEEYKKRQAYTCSKEYMMNEKGMTEEQWNEFNANRACTKKNFINRYGKEIGSKKWNEYCKLEAYAGNSLEYFIDTYGEIEGNRKYNEVCHKKAITLDNFIQKYGDSEGKTKYYEMMHRPDRVGYSIISQKIFEEIDKRLGTYSDNSKWALKNIEHEVEIEIDGKKKIAKLDYFLNGKIIEFNGDYWHCNPKFYKSDEKIKFHDKEMICEDVWIKDMKRNNYLIKLGYKVKVIWENDYRTNPEEVLKECVEFLKS